MLTPEQKMAGRAFRAQCVAELAVLSGDGGYYCSPYITWYRHTCGQRGSWALFLRQHYRTSPDGLFAFIWREGTCSACGTTVRSGSGRFVLAADNPPEKGAIVAAHQDSHVPQG